MKNLIITSLLFLSAFAAFSQDKIYRNDNSIIDCKVIEITVSEVKYKKAENLSGPDYILPKTEIAMIIYGNGTHEVMNATKTQTDTENAVIAILPFYHTGKNLISVNYFDLVYKNISLSYTRFLCNYRFSIHASASAGFTRNDNYNNGNSFLYFDKDYFHSSISFNYFPTGMNKVSYYTGLTLMAGKGGEYTYDYNSPYQLVDKNYYGFYVTNGVQFNITKHFNMRTALSLGLADRDMNGNFQSHAMFEVAAGIRF